jgi:hypothetical protein
MHFPKVYVSVKQEEGFAEKRRLVDHSLTSDSFVADQPVVDFIQLNTLLAHSVAYQSRYGCAPHWLQLCSSGV